MKTSRLLAASLFLSTVIAAPAFAAPAEPKLPLFALGRFAVPSADEIRNFQHFKRPTPPDSGTYTVIDAPGAGGGYGQGTFPWAINASGSVAGWYVDVFGTIHGFERAADGSYTTVDVGKIGSAAYGISAKGAIGGGYVDHKTDKCPGFLRTPSGHFKKFDPPDDVGTWPYGCAYIGPINKQESITGVYQGADNLYHAFVRTKDGTITEFDVPGAFDTYGWSTNDNGAIAGPYSDSSGDHGYIRAADGTFTLVDAPNGSVRGNVVAMINNKGETEGDYFDASNVVHGLLRGPDGTLVEYDASDAGTGSGQGTGAEGGINKSGTAAGSYLDSRSDPHGYLRTADGTITEFDPPGAIATYVWSINDNNVVTGFYIDTYGTFHGFLRSP